MSIIIELNQAELERNTTAGRESSGNIRFMGGSLYIPDLDMKWKNGTYSIVRLSGSFREGQGVKAKSVLDATVQK